MALSFGFRPLTFFGIAALVLIAGGALRNEWLGPQIRPVPVMSSDPLTLRFTIVNPAFLVRLKDIDMTCKPLRVGGHGARGAWTAEAQDFPLDVDIDLGPRMAFEYTCPFKSAGIRGPIDRVEAEVALRYTRFGRREESRSAVMSWNSLTRVWTQE